MSRHIDRAIFFAERGRHQDAVREFFAHLSHEPGDGFVHACLATNLAWLQQFEDAYYHAGQAIHLRPEDCFSYLAMADVAYRHRQMPEAAKWIEEALEHDPQNAKCFQLLAAIRAEQRMTAESRAAIESCLAIDPENVYCLNLRSALELRENDSFSASQTAREALALNPESSLAHIHRSFFSLRQGQYSSAVDSIREGLRLDPESAAGRHAYRQALKFANPFLRFLLVLHHQIQRGAPFVLAWLTWIVFRAEKQSVVDPGGYSAAQVTVDLLGYTAGLCLVFVKPVSDLFLLLFREGRQAIDPLDWRVSARFLLVAGEQVLSLGIALAIAVPASCICGFFLLLPAMIVAMPHRLAYSWNDSRRRMLQIMVAAPIAILLPLILNWIPWDWQYQGRAVVMYEALVAVACMGAFYYLRRVEESSR